MTDVRVLYVDIDGTVRHGYDELGHWVNEPDDVVIFDGVPELLWDWRNAGGVVIGVSNQGGIALGHVTDAQVTETMIRTDELCDGAFDRILWCPHHPDATEPALARCWCRKPRPGLLVRAATTLEVERRPLQHSYPPHLALMVGDREEDAGAAAAAGISFQPAAAWRGDYS